MSAAACKHLKNMICLADPAGLEEDVPIETGYMLGVRWLKIIPQREFTVHYCSL